MVKHGPRMNWTKPLLEKQKENPQKGYFPGIQLFLRADGSYSLGIRTPISQINIKAKSVLYEPTAKPGIKTILQYLVVAEKHNRKIKQTEAIDWVKEQIKGWDEEIKENELEWERK